MTRKKQPAWLSLSEILAIHEQLIAIYGGSNGLRDQGLLESALSRPKNLLAYENVDIFELAAAYADGIVNNHPFIDGNKRTGFVAAIVFLESNGVVFMAAEEDVVTMSIGLANKSVSKEQYAKWLREASEVRA